MQQKGFIFIDLNKVKTDADIQLGKCDVCGVETKIEKYAKTRGIITMKCGRCLSKPINRYVRGPVRGQIYMITNTKNYRIYIGSTIKSLEERMSQHIKNIERAPGRLLYRAMRQHGKETFNIRQIEIDDYKTEEDMLARESFWIRVMNTHESGYNEVLPDSVNAGIFSKMMQGKLFTDNDAMWITYAKRYKEYKKSPEYAERVRQGYWENIRWQDVYGWFSKKKLLKKTDEAEIIAIAKLDAEGVRIRSV